MKQRNPLSIIWKIFSHISGIISLASFTDNLIAWKVFIIEAINVYKTVVYFPLGLIISLKQILFEKEELSERKIKVRFVQWIGVLLFGFIFIVIINSLF